MKLRRKLLQMLELRIKHSLVNRRPNDLSLSSSSRTSEDRRGEGFFTVAHSEEGRF